MNTILKNTRREAHETVDKGLRYIQIKWVLASNGRMTAKQIAEKMFQMGWIPEPSRQIPAPRLTELERMNEVTVRDSTIDSSTGRRCGLYELC